MKRFASFLAVIALSSQLVTLSENAEIASSSVSRPVSDALTAEDIESVLSLPHGTLYGITVTSLPSYDSGRLICEGVEIEAFDYLPRSSLDWLVFESFSNNSSAGFSVLPDTVGESRECSLSLVYGDTLSTPVVIRSDVLVWKQVESDYFSKVIKGY